MGRFSSHDVMGLVGHRNSRGYSVMLQYAPKCPHISVLIVLMSHSDVIVALGFINATSKTPFLSQK